MKVNRSIFRDYDIRGVYPTDLNEEVAEVIGKAFGSYLVRRGLKNVVVGRDNRASSLFLTENFIKGLLSTGANVTYIGLTLTPVIHLLTCGVEFDAGVEVTASHNPKEYNGFRIDLQGAEPFYGSEIQKLYTTIESDKFEVGEGVYVDKNAGQRYVDFMANRFKFNSELKVVVDCGGGASSQLAEEIFTKCGLKPILISCDYDSRFEKFVPDPENPVYMAELSKEVVKHSADIGVCFDTDGDRVGFVDDKGVEHSTDRVLTLLAEEVLTHHKHAKFLCDIKSSSQTISLIHKFGGTCKMIRTGHPYFVRELKTSGALLGAEYSGHMYFADDYFGFDDGIYAALRMIELLDTSEKPQSLSSRMAKIPHLASTREIKVPIAEKDKAKTMEEIKTEIFARYPAEKLVFIDGVRVNINPHEWFLIRMSNTTPFISFRAEAKTQNELETLIKEVSSYTKLPLISLN